MKADIPDDKLAEPLAREMSRALLAPDVAGQIHPAAAALVREGVAVAVERYLRNREWLTIEELAAAFNWSVRQWRAWARKVGLPQAAGGGDVYRADAVRAKLDFTDGRKSKSRIELEKKIEGLELQIARLLEGERRRQEAERQEPTLRPVRAA